MLPPLTAWKRTLLELERLETREVPAIAIQLDYSLDLRANGGSGFFETHPEAKVVMNRVAQEMGQRISANLSAIIPGNGNTWTATIYNPVTGGQYSIRNLRVAADTIIVYVGGRAMAGTAVGVGGYGGYSWSGSQAWGRIVETRGWQGFSTWGGSIAFNTSTNWHLGLTTAGLDANEVDFYSVATHELGHLLGIGTAPQWFSHIVGGRFTGPHTTSLYGGPLSVSGEGSHWADGITYQGQPLAMDPILNYGTRVTWTPLDQASLRDLGWANGSPVSPPVTPPTVPPPPVSPPPAGLPPVGMPGRLPVLVSGVGDGMVYVFARGTDGNLAYTGQSFQPFAGFTGTVRTAVADFNNDGVADYAFATSAGGPAQVRVIDGVTRRDLLPPTQVLGGFHGGAFIAAGDVNRDGRADLVVSADAGGSPTVEVYQINSGNLSLLSRFLPFNSNLRAGVRVAMGDVNRDGVADLVVGVGPGVVPRVALFDGSSLTSTLPQRLNPAFLAFGRLMKQGVNVAVGDVDGDGFADVIISQDGGSTRVRVWSGSTITAAPTMPLNRLAMYQQFFANGIQDRNGIRIVVRDLNGDGKAEVVTSAARGNAGWLRVLSVTNTGVDALTAVFPFASQAVTAGLATNSQEVQPEQTFSNYAPPGGPCLCCTPGFQVPMCRRVINS
jgi:hypothetical protein